MLLKSACSGDAMENTIVVPFEDNVIVVPFVNKDEP
jgi:hypothetical protein